MKSWLDVLRSLTRFAQALFVKPQQPRFQVHTRTSAGLSMAQLTKQIVLQLVIKIAL